MITAGSCTLFFLFDVAHSIDLDGVQGGDVDGFKVRIKLFDYGVISVMLTRDGPAPGPAS
jgi:hypothetical protein